LSKTSGGPRKCTIWHTGWEPAPAREKDILDQPVVAGQKTLHILNGAGRGVLSWRLPVLLEEGRYRFFGRLMTRAVKPGAEIVMTGATILAATGVPAKSLPPRCAGDTPWRQVEHDFEIPAGGAEISLLLTMRCFTGEAWFDADSLKLRRSTEPRHPSRTK
jgi:hypothetical protein